MGELLLVLGGQKSGKSSYATERAAASGLPVVVMAPAVVRDDEFRERVARHRADRPPSWRTLETFDLVDGLRMAGDEVVVLIDALDTWLAETLLELGVELDDEGPTPQARSRAESEVGTRLEALLAAVRRRSGLTVLIAGQPGLGPHVIGRGARAYVDLHGIAVQTISNAADEAVLLVAGRPLPLDSPAPRHVPALLREHGDTQVAADTVDLAVNVLDGPPAWLAHELAEASQHLAAYPDDTRARTAAAHRHGRPPGECLVLAGAAEAFWLLPRVLRPRLAACVHPSFTEPEAALRSAGTPVVRVFRAPEQGWALDPDAVPDGADLVIVGRPENPTGVVDEVDAVRRLCRAGRTVVVDEAFAEFLPDADGLASRRDLPGLVCVRSLTKLWGVAGLRVGYLLAEPALVSALDAARQPWSGSSLGLLAVERLVGDEVEVERRSRAETVAAHREVLLAALRSVPGATTWDAGANFVLLRSEHPDLRGALLERGFSVRKGETFPGLDRRYVRLAVREPATSRRVVAAIRAALEADGRG